jgi:hypothetical protein
VTCTDTVSNAFGASYILLSCEHDILPSWISDVCISRGGLRSSQELLSMRLDNSHSNCTAREEGRAHNIARVSSRSQAMQVAKLIRLADEIVWDHGFIKDFVSKVAMALSGRFFLLFCFVS